MALLLPYHDFNCKNTQASNIITILCFTFQNYVLFADAIFYFTLDLEERILKQQQEEEQRKRERRERKKEKKVVL